MDKEINGKEEPDIKVEVKNEGTTPHIETQEGIVVETVNKEDDE